MEEKNAQTMRLFIAIDMPREVIEQADLIQQELKKLQLFEGNYTKHDGMHITLQFLGDVDIAQFSDIDAALQNVHSAPMVARLGAVDSFHSGSHIKIIYLHLICNGLATLVGNINAALKPLFEPEERTFIAHLTLARVKKTYNARVLLDAINKLSVEPLSFTIQQFALKQSQLFQEGPIYKDLIVYPLR
ncbi:MAG TPA: RNA 2',3'-cyclic phosphodiesterase [Candidatus Babeliales bacterium]|nr:RNA 2',3'-cyclic phosphodiesterase [Candidatus Babeliales bacterium]